MTKKNTSKTNGLRQKTHESVDRIIDQAERVNQNGKDTARHVKDKALLTQGNVNGYIQKNPKKTAMIAAGVGVVAGSATTAALMMKKRKHQSQINAESDSTI